MQAKQMVHALVLITLSAVVASAQTFRGTILTDMNGYRNLPAINEAGVFGTPATITVTPDVGIGNPFLGGGGPRNIQLALKLIF